MSNNSSSDTLAFRRELQLYIYNVNHILLYIQIFICVVGTSGNILALIVINRKSLKKSSSSVFITYMAIFDTTVLLVHAPSLIKFRYSAFLHCTLLYLENLSTFCANWVLVIITLERCLAVHSPFLAKRFSTINFARRSIYTLLVVSILFVSVPFPLIYQKQASKCYIRKEATLIARIYQSTILYFLPDSFLISNLYTLHTLCQRRQRLSTPCIINGNKVQMHVSDVNSSRKQRQLTVMLVTVSLSFYLFTTPAQIFYIKRHERPTHRNLQKIKHDFLFEQISVILSQLNSATNFIFYCLAGKRFRQETIKSFHHYSRQLKLFYHRYILCNKQYYLAPDSRRPSNCLSTTMLTTRSSSSPAYQLAQYRTSTI